MADSGKNNERKIAARGKKIKRTNSSDSDNIPQSKRLKTPGANNCLICDKSLFNCTPCDFVKFPTKQGILSIFKASEVYRDDVYERILAKKDDILGKKFPVFFHNSCRSSYTSSTNLLRFKEKSVVCSVGSNIPSTSLATQQATYTRSHSSNTSDFSIRTHCIICGNIRKLKKAKESLTPGNGFNNRQTSSLFTSNGRCVPATPETCPSADADMANKSYCKTEANKPCW